MTVSPIIIDNSEEINSLQEGIKRLDKQMFDMKSRLETFSKLVNEVGSKPSQISLSEIQLLHNLEDRVPEVEEKIKDILLAIKSFEKIQNGFNF